MTLGTSNPQGQNRGISAVAIVLLLTSSLILLMAGVGELATKRFRTISGDAWDTKARYSSYAGAQYALLNLTLDPFYATTGATFALPGEPDTTFTIRVTNNYSGTTPMTVGTISIPAGMCYIQSEGQTRQGGRAFSTATASLAYRGDSFFNHAAMAQGQVSVDNSIVDAYWSYVEFPAGTYTYYQYGDGSQYGGLINPNPGIPAEVEQASNGNLGSNSTQNAITITNNSQVFGIPVVGPLSTLANAYTDDGSNVVPKPPQVGTATKRVARYRPPMNPALAATAVNVPAGATVILPPDNAYTSVTVAAGGNLVLQGGTYMFTGAVNIAGDLSLDYAPLANDPAATNVYLGGDIDISGRVNPHPTLPGAGGLAEDLRLVAMGAGTPNSRITMNATGAQMWAAIGGRGLDVNLTANTQMHGGIVANSITMSNSGLHYDRNLYDRPQEGLATWSMVGMVEDEKEDVDFSSGGAAAGPAGPAAAAATGPAGPAATGPALGGGDAVGPGDAGGDAAGDAHAGDAGAGGDAAGDAVGPAGGPAAAAAAAATGPAVGPAATTGTASSGGSASSGDGDTCY